MHVSAAKVGGMGFDLAAQSGEGPRWRAGRHSETTQHRSHGRGRGMGGRGGGRRQRQTCAMAGGGWRRWRSSPTTVFDRELAARSQWPRPARQIGLRHRTPAPPALPDFPRPSSPLPSPPAAPHPPYLAPTGVVSPWHMRCSGVLHRIVHVPPSARAVVSCRVAA